MTVVPWDGDPADWRARYALAPTDWDAAPGTNGGSSSGLPDATIGLGNLSVTCGGRDATGLG
jgi:hypothetical protein